jgi:hypothetical protein
MVLRTTSICMDKYFHVNERDSGPDFGLDIAFVDHINTQHVIAFN